MAGRAGGHDGAPRAVAKAVGISYTPDVQDTLLKDQQMMRVRVIFPTARSVYPDSEVELRTATLKSFCGPQTQIEFAYPAGACTFKQNLTWADFEKAMPDYLETARQAEQDGCDAVMIHCVYDPGYAEIRRSLRIPVVGFGQSVFHAAVQIAPRFGLIAPNDSLMKEAYDVLDQYGVRERLAWMEPLNVQLPEAHKRGDELRRRSVEIAQHAKEHGAGVVIPFGMALIPTHLRTANIRAGAGIPVLNPAEIGIRTAEVIMAALR
jgi:allantoin racemase